MHFSLEADRKAKCYICQKLISLKSGSTNNLHRHFKTQHPTVKISEVRREHDSDDEVESASTSASTSGRRRCCMNNTSQSSFTHIHTLYTQGK